MEIGVSDLDDKPPRSEAEQGGVQISRPPVPLEYGLAPPRFVIPLGVTIGVVVGATGIGAFCCMYYRTMDWGFSLRTFLFLSMFSLLCLGPFVVMASLGRRVRTMLICLAIVAVLSPLIAECLATVQEIDFVRRSKLAPGTPMNENRWWPFQSSAIGTDGKGTFFGYD